MIDELQGNSSFINNFIAHTREALLHLFFPHLCAGCGSDQLNGKDYLCLHCLSDLPQTGFELLPDNPAEKIFWGRIHFTAATAQYYFTSQSLMQSLLHQFKYKSYRELGFYLGRLMGEQLLQAPWFKTIDALLPLPLHVKKEKQRGFNQSAILCEGISSLTKKPVLYQCVKRTDETISQTRKTRIERSQNMEGKFECIKPDVLKGLHILLVDDVLTTGATMEACAQAILQSGDVTLSMASLCLSV